MQIDKITFNDISIFHPEEEFSIFHKLNFTRTVGGKDWLRKFFSEPHADIKKIRTVVLVDRNHKRYPIAADYVGMSLATTLQEHVAVEFDNGEEAVFLS